MRLLDSITDLIHMSFGELWELVMDREVWLAVIHGVTKSRIWLSGWTELRSQISISSALLILQFFRRCIIIWAGDFPLVSSVVPIMELLFLNTVDWNRENESLHGPICASVPRSFAKSRPLGILGSFPHGHTFSWLEFIIFWVAKRWIKGKEGSHFSRVDLSHPFCFLYSIPFY